MDVCEDSGRMRRRRRRLRMRRGGILESAWKSDAVWGRVERL